MLKDVELRGGLKARASILFSFLFTAYLVLEQLHGASLDVADALSLESPFSTEDDLFLLPQRGLDPTVRSLCLMLKRLKLL